MNSTPNEKVASAKKKQGRFNFIDFILILILVAVVAALVYVFSPISWIRGLFQSNEETIRYTVEITNVEEEYLNLIKENELVGNSVTKSSIGKVYAVDYNNRYTEYVVNSRPATVEGDENSAKYVVEAIEYPDRYNIIITIEVKADYAEDVGYSVDSTRIAVGEKMYLKFPSFSGEGYCIGIAKV